MKKTVLCGVVCVLVLGVSGLAQAQPPAGPPPLGEPGFGPPPGFGGQGGRPNRPGGPMGMMPRQLSLALVPVEVLDHYLNLSDGQATQIEAVIEKLRAEMPRPPQPPQPGQNGERPQPPNREEMEARRSKMETAQKQASKEIEAVLNPEQRKEATILIKAMNALQSDRIAMPALVRLNLTSTQLQKLAALGETATPEKVQAILTAEQREVAEANRMRGRGPGGTSGSGRPGGPPPGGFGGPPPGGAPF